MRFIFGPVPSRRLGLSLGVDLVPGKTCTYDCVYCQLGRTTRQTTRRASYVSMAKVATELREALKEVRADYITLSGSGEPTLCSHLDELIAAIKDLTDLPVAVLTNGSLLSRPAVRRELARADLVIPSLDAGSPETFAAINRPAAGLRLEKAIAGLREFAANFAGRIWLEVMLVAGMNDNERELGLIAAAAGEIRAEKIQLNTVERPPAEPYVRALTPAELEKARQFFDERAEIIAGKAVLHAANDRSLPKAAHAAVLALLRRRPCTVDDVATGLGLPPNLVVKLLRDLLASGEVLAWRPANGDKTYYRFNKPL
ncbi:MAG: radical SAM protein [Bacillota bacterium]